MRIGRLLLRLTVGGLFFGHGTQKLFGWLPRRRPRHQPPGHRTPNSRSRSYEDPSSTKGSSHDDFRNLRPSQPARSRLAAT